MRLEPGKLYMVFGARDGFGEWFCYKAIPGDHCCHYKCIRTIDDTVAVFNEDGTILYKVIKTCDEGVMLSREDSTLIEEVPPRPFYFV